MINPFVTYNTMNYSFASCFAPSLITRLLSVAITSMKITQTHQSDKTPQPRYIESMVMFASITVPLCQFMSIVSLSSLFTAASVVCTDHRLGKCCLAKLHCWNKPDRSVRASLYKCIPLECLVVAACSPNKVGTW